MGRIVAIISKCALIITLLLIGALQFSSCSDSKSISPRTSKIKESTAIPPSEVQLTPPSELPMPPWQVWPTESFGNADLERGDTLAREGDFSAAVDAYAAAEQSAMQFEVREDALLRRCGTLLKLGRSKEVLDLLSEFSKRERSGVESLHPRLAFLASFAYEHQGNLNQIFAWLGVAAKQESKSGDIVRAAKKRRDEILRGLSAVELEKLAGDWAGEKFLSGALERERMRRAGGGVPEVKREPDWFNPVTYRKGVGAFPEMGDIGLPVSSGKLALGLMLPLSGRFAEPSSHVREGIELAIEKSGFSDKVELVAVDTREDPLIAVQEYERLVNQFAAIAVFGPLLAATSEAVAGKSNELGVPVISFSKRRGIPELSPSAYRFGATSEDQTEEIVRYARTALGISKFIIAFSPSDVGSELTFSFEQSLANHGGAILGKVSTQSSTELLRSELERLIKSVGEGEKVGVLIADSLERSIPVINASRSFFSTPPQGSTVQDSNVIFFGTAQWHDPVAIRAYGTVLNGSYYVTPFYSHGTDVRVVNFVNQYRQKYGREPEILSAQAYDIAEIVLVYLKQGVVDFSELLQRLNSADSIYNGVTGGIAVNQYGDFHRRMSVIQVVDGGTREIMFGGKLIGFLEDNGQKKENESASTTAGDNFGF